MLSFLYSPHRKEDTLDLQELVNKVRAEFMYSSKVLFKELEHPLKLKGFALQ